MKFKIVGRDLARMLDNVILFATEGPATAWTLDRVLWQGDNMARGLSLLSSDGYAIAREMVGDPFANATAFETSVDVAKDIARSARSAGAKWVIGELHEGGLWVEGTEDPHDTSRPDERWAKVEEYLPNLANTAKQTIVPAVPWALDRLQRFGRVKVPAGWPKAVDLWFEDSRHGGPICHALVGPTFQGALKCLDRDILRANYPDVRLWR